MVENKDISSPNNDKATDTSMLEKKAPPEKKRRSKSTVKAKSKPKTSKPAATKTTKKKTTALTVPPEEPKNKGGRPPRFSSPEQMEEECLQWFQQTMNARKGVPFIHKLEWDLHFRFDDYIHKEEFTEVITRMKAISGELMEYACLSGRVPNVAANLYLKCRRGYIDESKVKVESAAPVNMEVFNTLIMQVQELPEASKEAYIEELEAAYEELEDAEKEEV